MLCILLRNGTCRTASEDSQGMKRIWLLLRAHQPLGRIDHIEPFLGSRLESRKGFLDQTDQIYAVTSACICACNYVITLLVRRKAWVYINAIWSKFRLLEQVSF